MVDLEYLRHLLVLHKDLQLVAEKIQDNRQGFNQKETKTIKVMETFIDKLTFGITEFLCTAVFESRFSPQSSSVLSTQLFEI